MEDLLHNPYVTGGLLAACIVALWKVYDQFRDKRQKTAQNVAKGMREVGLVDLPDGLEAYARDGWEDFFRTLHSIEDKLSKPDGVIDTICEVYEKTFEKAMANPRAKLRLQPLLAKHLLGFLLDGKTKAELVEVAHTLAEFGSKELQKFVGSLGADDLDAARTNFQQFIALLRDRDRIDDVLIDRAKTTIPKLMQQPEHAATLRVLVNGPPSIDEQIAALQKKKAVA